MGYMCYKSSINKKLNGNKLRNIAECISNKFISYKHDFMRT